MGRLSGKVAIITGATSGIGLRTAEIFVAEGARVVIAGRRIAEREALTKQLGADCIFRQTDVTVEDQVKALTALAVEKFGRLDCVFNNAGGPAQTGGIEGLEVERFDLAMATLVRSVMLGMKHAAPIMKKQGFGSIINNGSIAGRLAGFSSSMVYSAAKAAVIHLTKCVAMELGEAGVRVNSISPGAIATGIFAKALGLTVEAAENTPPVMREAYKSAQPIPRAGLPDDISGQVGSGLGEEIAAHRGRPNRMQHCVAELVTSVSAVVIALTVILMLLIEWLYGLERLLVGRHAETS